MNHTALSAAHMVIYRRRRRAFRGLYEVDGSGRGDIIKE